MPNIELHGIEEEVANTLRRRIFQFFQGKPYVDEMVVTVYPTRCWDRHGEPQPFIRLVNSCQAHNSDEIIDVLEMLDMDIEHLVLEKFIPKDKGDGE